MLANGRKNPGLRSHGRASGCRAFTVIDVLVTMGVVSILIGILVPTLSNARESANRVVCGSNVRQGGLALSMYADDTKGFLPSSVFLSPGDTKNKSGSEADAERPDQMLMVRVNKKVVFSPNPYGWDGLGYLFEGGYLYAPKIFYCPSHRGSNPFAKYQELWTSPAGEIASNYQYRGEGPDGERKLYLIEPSSSALVTDGMRTAADYNHRVGSNVLRADLAVRWHSDDTNIIDRLPPEGVRTGGDGSHVRGAWRDLDDPSVAR